MDSEHSCTRDVILAIDATSYMGTRENIRSEFDFIENWIIPRLDVRKGYVQVGMTTYGYWFNYQFLYFNYNREQICDNLEKLWNNVDIDSANNVPLSRTIRNLFNNFGFDYTSLVLFTGDREQTDVDAAGAQVEYYIDNRMALNFSVVVVNYGNCSFNSWPKLHTNVYDASTIGEDQLSDYVDDSVCAPVYPTTTSTQTSTSTTAAPSTTSSATPSTTSDCGTGVDCITTSTGYSVSTDQPTWPPATIPNHVVTSGEPTARPAPTVPSLPVANINNTGCNCVLKTVWLDVFLLMEATNAMTPGGIISVSGSTFFSSHDIESQVLKISR
ncbi:hypothetical protein COOONC_15845 [Cooperia oncophora]